MKPIPRVSVVIPHLNDNEELRRCLARLDAQVEETPAFEVIVADNGSVALPEAVSKRALSTRIVVERHPGPGPARNAGAAVARGDIIAFIDADCHADPDWLARIVAAFDADPDLDYTAGRILVEAATPGRPNGVEAYEAVFSYRVKLFVERDRYAATGNMAVRRKVFGEVGPFDGLSRAEDRAWGQRAAALGYRIAYLPEARVSTSGCRNFAELATRLDRLVAHNHAERRSDLRWIIQSAMMAGSPLRDLFVLAASPEISGARAKLLAAGILIRIRLYRAWRMLELMTRNWSDQHLASWNRLTPTGHKDGRR